MYLEATPDRPYPVYSRNKIVPTPGFPYALEDFLGNIGWRDWDNRIAESKLVLRGCRGNGYVDLNASYLHSASALLEGKYDIVAMRTNTSNDNFSYYIYFSDLEGYVDLGEIIAKSSLTSVTQLLGWSNFPNGVIPTDFTKFDRKTCPVQVCIRVPKQ